MAGMAENGRGDAANALDMFLVIDGVAGRMDTPQFGIELRAGEKGLGREALELDAPARRLQFGRRQPGDDRLPDSGGVHRPLRAEILHHAHRAVGIAFGDDHDDAAAIRGKAGALARAPCQLGDERAGDLAQLLGRPGAAGQAEQLRRQLVAPRHRVLVQIAKIDQGLEQMMRCAAMQADPARCLGERRGAPMRRDGFEQEHAPGQRLMRDAGGRRAGGGGAFHDVPVPHL